MKNSKWITGVAVLALGASLAVAAPQGNHEGHGRGGHRGAFSERLATKLNLTDAQKQQIKDLNAQFRQDNKAFFEQARATREQMRDAKKANDGAKIDALKGTFEAQRAQMKQLREQQEARIATVLTPDQRAQWQQLKAQHAARKAQHDRQ